MEYKDHMSLLMVKKYPQLTFLTIYLYIMSGIIENFSKIHADNSFRRHLFAIFKSNKISSIDNESCNNPSKDVKF